MLVGFFKDNYETCSPRIVKFVDRIWILNHEGDVAVLRAFIVENFSQQSTEESLTKIKMLIPYRHVLDPLLRNQTCFNENLFFNSPKTRSTGKYGITTMPKYNNRKDDFGVIFDDGIENIKVYLNAKLDKLGIDSQNDAAGKIEGDTRGSTILELCFPQGATLAPGERAEFVLSFKINNLFDKLDSDGITIRREIMLEYFVGREWEAEIKLLGLNNEIKIIPGLGGATNAGGFDIFVYVPPTLEKIDGFDNKLKPSWHDTKDIDGVDTHTEWEKYLFRLRDIIKNKNIVGIGDQVSIIGKFVEKYDIRKAINNLSAKTIEISNKTDIDRRINRKRFIATLTISIIAFLATLTFSILRLLKYI